MILSHPLFSEPMVFSENTVNVLVVENKEAYRKIIFELSDPLNSKFILSDEDQTLKLQTQTDLIIDILNLDINSKKILTKVYDMLVREALNENMYMKTNALNTELLKYLEDLVDTVDFPLEHACQIDTGLLLKSADVRILDDSENLLEKVINYMLAMRNFIKINMFIFVNLKSWFGINELKKLYEFVFYEKINLLLIESQTSENVISNESVRIIDDDLCEIY